MKAGLAASKSATLTTSQADKTCCFTSSQDHSRERPAAAQGGSTLPLVHPPQAALPEISRQAEDPLYQGHGSAQKGSQQRPQELESASNGRAELQSSSSARTQDDPEECRGPGSVLAKSTKRLLPMEELIEKVPWAKPVIAAPSCENGQFDLLDGGLDFDPGGASSPAIVSMLALKPRGAAAIGEAERHAPRRGWRLPFAAPRAAPKSASCARRTAQDAAEPAAMRPALAAADAPSSAMPGITRDVSEGAGKAFIGEQSLVAGQRQPPPAWLTGISASGKSPAISHPGAAGQQDDAGHQSKAPEARVAPTDVYYDYADRDEYPDDDPEEGHAQCEEQFEECEPSYERPAAEGRRASNEQFAATADCRQSGSGEQQWEAHEAEPHWRSGPQQPEMDAPVCTGGNTATAERGWAEGPGLGDRLAGPSGRVGHPLQDSAHESRTPGGVSWKLITGGDVTWDAAHTHGNLDPAAQAPRSSLAANRSTQCKPKRRLVKLYSEEDNEEACKRDALDEQCEDVESTGLEVSHPYPH